jgi:flagellum-specific ATP synthase
MRQAARILDSVRAAEWIKRTGRIVRSVGLTVESEGPDARLGEICEISSRAHTRRTLAEVVGFAEGRVLLMPFEDLVGIESGSEVIATGESAHAFAGDYLLGRVIDGFGAPLDGRPLIHSGAKYPLYPGPLNPLERGHVRDVLETGVRAIDALLTIARGQRVGIFAGSGVGKSTVLGMIARQVQADVSVIALVGERGREVKAFVEEGLSEDARARSVVIAATSDQPPLVRRRAAFLATAIAEYFRDQGAHVCLTMDSVKSGSRAASCRLRAVTRHRYSPCCRSCSSAAVCVRRAARSPRCTPFWWKATTCRTRLPTPSARFWTAISCCRAR